MNLEEQTFQTIVSFVNKAKNATTNHKFDIALSYYKKAETTFPDPIINYDGAHFLYLSIAEVYNMQDNWDEAKINFKKALQCINSDNDFEILFKLGIIALNQDQTTEAIEYFRNVYKQNGKSMFLNEKLYLNFFEKEIFNS